jgi:RNA polymerase sigma factor (sigma-70 family)
MPSEHLQAVVRYLRRATAPGDAAAASDAQLLERYAQGRDESAFELLVWRHAQTVLGACRRLLRHEHDAHDCFQATFLALAREAKSIARRESVGGWLYRVACRIALRARAGAARRAARERPLDEAPSGRPGPCAEAEGRELGQALDEQVNRLPARYREVFVLRCLAGKSAAEAALELGCPVGTVESRLARARERLRAALARRGFTAPAGLLAGALAREALAPAPLVSATVKAATLFAAGQAASAGVVSASVAALAEGALRPMFLYNVKVATALVLALAVGTGTAGLARQRTGAEREAPAPSKAERQKPPAPKKDRDKEKERRDRDIKEFMDMFMAVEEEARAQRDEARRLAQRAEQQQRVAQQQAEAERALRLQREAEVRRLEDELLRSREHVGAWKVVAYLDAKGQEQPPVPGDTPPLVSVRFEKDDGRLTARIGYPGGKVKTARVQVGPGGKATAIDFTLEGGTQRGVFRLRDGKLHLVLPAKGKQRPGEFTTPENFAWVGLVLAKDNK